MTPQGWLKDGSVLICDGKILEVTNSDLAVIGATVIDARGMTIVPGFVSMHAHGGGGHDFTETTEESFRAATYGTLETWSYQYVSYFVVYFLRKALSGGRCMRESDEGERLSDSRSAYRGALSEPEDGGNTIYGDF